MLVYGHFWSLKTISRRSENHKFSRDRFFLFGPGRARREQPNAGLHLGVRAFVRSVSHVKVFFASLFLIFWKFASFTDFYTSRETAAESPCFHHVAIALLFLPAACLPGLLRICVGLTPPKDWFSDQTIHLWFLFVVKK